MNKYKIHKRHGLSLRKPWELVYPSGEALKFKTFTAVITQLRLLHAFCLEQTLAIVSKPVIRKEGRLWK